MHKIVKISRKTPVLKQPSFGCLKGVPSINITKGCIHGCVYCYARGFTDAPPKGEVHLYKDLPERLEQELQRKRRLPSWISFSTASDAFQNIDEILETTYSCMKLLLERGIGVSFLTKGVIPQEFIELFRKYPSLVKARIGLVSISEDFRSLFEPHTASIFERLKNLRDLIDAGIEVSVRIDPVIPSVTDNDACIESILKRLRASGIKNVSVSALVARPSIMEFFSEIPWSIAERIKRFYRGQPWQRVITSAKTRLLPADMRKKIYERFRLTGKRYGMEIKVCGCKNPDLPWEFCKPWVEQSAIRRQMVLFG